MEADTGEGLKEDNISGWKRITFLAKRA